ncbi:MAG TPA: HDOD domain-containing protein [Phycisphaerae bacterium]|nr:HDOD domain-containing protein [Phycisphaerae bacterium]HRR83533.1 HDOD domain-containing protein [Phycisphaerae bacterium]
MDTTVLELIKRSAAIPSMPQVAVRFLEIIQDPDFDYREVVEVLSSDPGTTCEILRLANSALFGVTRKVTALPHAMTLLGIKRIRSLVLGRYIVESLNRNGCASIEPAYYWRRSLTAAVLAARLADAILPDRREEAFISGLLADVGIVILDAAFPDKYRTIAEQYRPGGNPDLALTEEILLGTTHGKVSATVLDHWKLPEAICEAVHWHSWECREQGRNALADLTGAANRISTWVCEAPTDLDAVVADCREIAHVLNLAPETLARCLMEIEEHVSDLSSLLRIEVVSSQMYEVITTRISEGLTHLETVEV